MNQIVYLHRQPIQLDAGALLQSGGEGMVFAHEQQVIKLYHTPTAQQEEKLTAFLAAGFRLPDGMLAPTGMVRDADGTMRGLRMPQLPPGSRPLRKLTHLPFRRRLRIPQSHIVALLLRLHGQLTALHQLGIVVGDFNDSNIFFTHKPGKPLHAYWIDLDSCQFGNYSCPVAMESFLDPQLYAIKDFNQRPFTTLTDWYAFTVLTFKLLLGIHPYGGTHPQHKTIASRAQAGVTILHPQVKRPLHSLPPATLSDDLLAYLHAVHTAGERRPFPRRLLEAYLTALISCPVCHREYPQQRSHCPHCRQKAAPPSPHPAAHQPVFRSQGAVVFVQAQRDGRFLLVDYAQDTYTLVRAGIGGVLTQTPLFRGQPGYRFAAFAQTLVVNPPGRGKLLLLDIRENQPAQLQMLTTATFRETAVFAATPQALYRIAGHWIMRGIVRDGLYLEDVIATAHHRQTRFWAAPNADQIAGFHRIFTQYQFFGLDGRGNASRFHLPPPQPDVNILEVVLQPEANQTVINLEMKERGRVVTAQHYFSPTGSWRECRTGEDPDRTEEFWHPQGSLELRNAALYFKPQQTLPLVQ